MKPFLIFLIVLLCILIDGTLDGQTNQGRDTVGYRHYKFDIASTQTDSIMFYDGSTWHMIWRIGWAHEAYKLDKVYLGTYALTSNQKAIKEKE